MAQMGSTPERPAIHSHPPEDPCNALSCPVAEFSASVGRTPQYIAWPVYEPPAPWADCSTWEKRQRIVADFTAAETEAGEKHAEAAQELDDAEEKRDRRLRSLDDGGDGL